MNIEPQEVSPASYRCDCGCVANFRRDTFRKARDRSFSQRQWLPDDAGTSKHILILQDGKVTGLLCPSEAVRRREPARFTGARKFCLAAVAMVIGLATLVAVLSASRM